MTTAICIIVGLMFAGIVAWLIVLTVMIADNDGKSFIRHIEEKTESTKMMMEVYDKMHDMEERLNKKIRDTKKRSK